MNRSKTIKRIGVEIHGMVQRHDIASLLRHPQSTQSKYRVYHGKWTFLGWAVLSRRDSNNLAVYVLLLLSVVHATVVHGASRFLEIGETVKEVQHFFRRRFNVPRHGDMPSKHIHLRWVNGFHSWGSLMKKKLVGILHQYECPTLHQHLWFHPYKITIAHWLS